MNYQEFIQSKRKPTKLRGFDYPLEKINPMLKDWQKEIVRWAVRVGTAALLEDCGLGKSAQQLEWSRIIWDHTNKPSLILCPVAVAHQTEREASKFSIEAPVKIVREAADVINGINITNYEKLHLFDTSVFSSVVLDESQILKNYTGKTKQALCSSFRDTPFKLCCTATPAPNDRMEIGNHSDFLGVMPSDEMLCRWFINDTMKAGGYRLRSHARKDFWEWMSSWAVCIAKPSDIGFSDEGYNLPGLEMKEHIVYADPLKKGVLFNLGETVSATEVHQEKRACLAERASMAASLVNNTPGTWVVWCDTDYEADELIERIPDAIEVRGSHSEKLKEKRLLDFTEGRERIIITKPELGGLGLNWQHCHQTTWFAGYSFEKFYQSIRRLYRFGQTKVVKVHVVMSENEESIMRAVQRKQAEHQEMFCEMADQMKSGMMRNVRGVLELQTRVGEKELVLPTWLQH